MEKNDEARPLNIANALCVLQCVDSVVLVTWECTVQYDNRKCMEMTGLIAVTRTIRIVVLDI